MSVTISYPSTQFEELYGPFVNLEPIYPKNNSPKTKTTKEWADTSVLLSNFAIPSPPILFWSYLSMLTRWTSQRRADADDIMWRSTRCGRKFQNALIFLLLRGLKPNQKIQRATAQPLGQTCPLLYV